MSCSLPAWRRLTPKAQPGPPLGPRSSDFTGDPFLGHWWHSGGMLLDGLSLGAPTPVRGAASLCCRRNRNLSRSWQRSRWLCGSSCRWVDSVVTLWARDSVSLLSHTCSAFLPQVHIQTIGILVSEKAELHTALAHTQQAARQKAGGLSDAASSSVQHPAPSLAGGEGSLGLILQSLCHLRRV